MAPLVQIALLFGKLSLLAVGGVNSTLPAIEREVVDGRHWMTARAFAQIFAIAQSAPGPNMLVVVASGLWERFRAARWRRVLQAAILPITAGLVLAAAAVLVEAADTSFVLAAVTAAATWANLRTKWHPLWVLAGGTVVGLLVW